MPYNTKRTNNYHRFLQRQRISFSCHHCNRFVLIKDYEGHCTREHDLNSRLCCVWCDGKRFWSKGQKDQMIDDHIKDCLQNFLLPRPEQIPESSPKTTYVRFDTTPKCEAMQLYHSKLSRLHTMAYENFRTTPPNHPLKLTFQDEDLNAIASYVRMFVERPDLEFYHIMVRAPAMNRFLEVVQEEDHNNINFLPHSCWCDGGTEEDAWFRQHRHMIAVAPKGGIFMSKIWNRLSREEMPPNQKYYRCRRSKKIESAWHLVNVIGYVSQRESACNFTYKKGEEDEGRCSTTGRRNHFYVTKSVPRDFKIAACLQWDGGVARLLNQKFKTLDPDKFVHAPVKRVNLKWRIRYIDVPGIPLNIVLPVAKHFKPSNSPTEYYVHLTNGRKFYFQIDREWRDDETWHDKQVEMGNLFYHVLGDDAWWQLAPHQQRHVNSVKHVWKRLEALEEENSRITADKYRIETENVRMKEKLEEKDRIIEECKLTIADKDRIIEEHLKRKQDMNTYNFSIHSASFENSFF